jgi:hypothetical protein
MFEIKVVEKIKTHMLYTVTFFFFENCAVYERMAENMVVSELPQITLQHDAYELHALCARIHARKHTPTFPGTRTHAHTHTHKYVIFIAFLHRQ